MHELEVIESTFNTSKQYKLPTQAKPCIAAMLSEVHEKNINDLSFIIAIELKRLGKDAEASKKRLLNWNSKNIKKLNPRDIERTINNVYMKNYQHGCNHHLLKMYCYFSEKDLCPYYSEFIKAYPTKNFNRQFIKLEWPKYLNNISKILYVLVIPELETRRNYKPGDKIFANYNEMREIGGTSQASVKPGLLELERVGLIKLKIGQRHKHYNIATEIQRTIPLPEPSLKVVKVKTKK